MDEIPALAMQRVAAGRAKCKRSTKKSCSFSIHFNFVQVHDVTKHFADLQETVAIPFCARGGCSM
jgi:hypothetical protein